MIEASDQFMPTDMTPYERTLQIQELEKQIKLLTDERDELIWRAQNAEKRVLELEIENFKVQSELDEMKGFYQT